MSTSRFDVLAYAGVSLLTCSGLAHAQEVPTGTTNTQEQASLDARLKPAAHRVSSPERFFLELKAGPYRVFSGERFDIFKDDPGLSWTAQLDGIVWRLPDFVYVTAGAGFGYAGYAATATAQAGEDPVTEETTLSLVPVSATAGIRVDALPRQLGIPVIVAARVGWQWSHWDTNTGLRNDADGWSVGPLLSAQLALDLDSFEKGAARALDEEWGINHTYLFGEISHYATTAKSLPVGGTHWALGIGFAF